MRKNILARKREGKELLRVPSRRYGIILKWMLEGPRECLHSCGSGWKSTGVGRAMAQAVSRRPLTTEARVRSQVKSM
jgi:hypothetical protein